MNGVGLPSIKDYAIYPSGTKSSVFEIPSEDIFNTNSPYPVIWLPITQVDAEYSITSICNLQDENILNVNSVTPFDPEYAIPNAYNLQVLLPWINSSKEMFSVTWNDLSEIVAKIEEDIPVDPTHYGKHFIDEKSMFYDSYKSSIEKIQSFIHLPSNWDTYGAEAIPQDACTNSIDFLLELFKCSWSSGFSLQEPFIAPSPDGTIEFEWESEDGNKELSVTVTALKDGIITGVKTEITGDAHHTVEIANSYNSLKKVLDDVTWVNIKQAS